MHYFPIVEIGGIRLELSTIITLVLTCTIVFIIARLATRNLSMTNPSRMQRFIEWLVDFVGNIIGNTMDRKTGRPFLALGVTLLMFIFVGNMLGLPFSIQTQHSVPMESIGIGEALVNDYHERGEEGPIVVWTKSPTADASVTMALAIMVFFIVHINALKRNPKYYLKSYLEPVPAFFPLNILKQISKPVTHGMRLFGNIYAGEILIGVLVGAGFFGVLPLVAWTGFSMFIGSIQAFIFVVLSMVYISMEIKQDA